MLTGIKRSLIVKNIKKEKRDMINIEIERERKLENYIGI